VVSARSAGEQAFATSRLASAAGSGLEAGAREVVGENIGHRHAGLARAATRRPGTGRRRARNPRPRSGGGRHPGPLRTKCFRMARAPNAWVITARITSALTETVVEPISSPPARGLMDRVMQSRSAEPISDRVGHRVHARIRPLASASNVPGRGPGRRLQNPSSTDSRYGASVRPIPGSPTPFVRRSPHGRAPGSVFLETSRSFRAVFALTARAAASAGPSPGAAGR